MKKLINREVVDIAWMGHELKANGGTAAMSDTRASEIQRVYPWLEEAPEEKKAVKKKEVKKVVKEVVEVKKEVKVEKKVEIVKEEPRALRVAKKR